MCIYKKDNPKFLEIAFKSLLKQSIYIKEIILVEDGKLTEELKNIIKKFKIELNINQIKLDKNVGFPKALNIGLSNSSTKWIARFDCDDICDIGRFKKINEIIDKYGNQIDVFGTFMKEFENDLHDKNKIRYVPLSEESIKRKLILSNPMNHISVVFKRSLIYKYCEKGNEFYPLIQGFEDYALWIKLLKQGVKFRNFPYITVYARIGKEMLKRRGGIKYIKNEIRFRIFTFKYFNIFENLLIFFISLIRISIFLMPLSLKGIFYKIKRKFF